MRKEKVENLKIEGRKAIRRNRNKKRIVKVLVRSEKFLKKIKGIKIIKMKKNLRKGKKKKM